MKKEQNQPWKPAIADDGVSSTPKTYMHLLFENQKRLTEEPIDPDERLSIFLYRMRRSDYIHTVAELFGVGDCTVCNIVL